MMPTCHDVPLSPAPYHDLPKIELHRHLEGSIRWRTLLEFARTNHVDAPVHSEKAFRGHVQYVHGDARNLMTFLEKFRNDWYGSLDDVYRVAHEAVLDAAEDHVIYLELRFSPVHFAAKNGFAIRDTANAVIRGARDAASGRGILVKFLITLSRSKQSPRDMHQAVHAVLSMGHEDVVGVDLAGDEIHYPPELFQDFFQDLRRHTTLGFSIHAGEVTHPGQVRRAVDLLHADRIGHGIRAVDCPDTIRLLKDKNIPLEICPTSNYQTGAVEDMSRHPLVALLKQRVPVTINTDDPCISDITLSSELRMVAERMHLGMQALKALQLHAIGHAFLDDTQKDALRRRLLALWP